MIETQHSISEAEAHVHAHESHLLSTLRKLEADAEKEYRTAPNAVTLGKLNKARAVTEKEMRRQDPYAKHTVQAE